MTNDEKLRMHLSLWMTDTCNRYLHALTDLGVVDKRKLKTLSSKVVEKRNEMLDEYVPFFTETTFELLRAGNGKNKSD